MIIQNPLLTGSLSYNGADLSNVTSSNANSASVSLILTAVSSSNQQVSASYIALSASYNVFSGSASTRITTISASQQDISASLLQVSASYTALSGSYNVFSGSASTRVSQIETVYATTGSNSFRANQSITGSLVVSSTITAQTLIVQTVTSSIVFSSGSNNFGNQLSNNQTFTGSVNITGSLALAGNITSNGTAVMLGTGSTNYLPKFTGTSTIGNSAITDDGTTVTLISRALSGTSATFSGALSLSNNNTFPSGAGIFQGSAYLQIVSGVNGFTINNNANTVTNIMVTNAGNVGIGTTSPSYLLDVNGTFRATGAATFSSSVTANGLLTVTSSGVASVFTAGNGGYSALSFTGDNGATYGSMTTSGNTILIGSRNVGATGSNGELQIVPYAARIMILTNGKVAIGGTSPNAPLDVTSISTSSSEIQQWSYNSAPLAYRLNLNTIVSSQLVKYSFDLVNNSTAYPNNLVLDRGNVGINTTSPDWLFRIEKNTALSSYGLYPAAVVANSNASGYSAYYLFSGTSNLGGIEYSNGENLMRVFSAGQTLFVQGGSERMRITSGGNTQPGTDNAYSLGVNGIRWSAVWAATGTILTSDEREKKDIVECDLGLDFVSKLRPVSYKWIVGKNVATSEIVKDEEGNPILDEDGKEKTESVITPIEGKRTHYGLIAQEVEALLNGKDFGGFIHDKETDIKGLRYDQFVPLLIKAIQELKATNDDLQSQINELKAI